MAESLLQTETEVATDTGVAGSGGEQTGGSGDLPGWAQGLDAQAKEDLKQRITANPEFLKDTKGLSDIYRGWTQRLTYDQRAFVPDKDAPEEEWTRFYKAIGVPESPDGYAFDKVQLPEGMNYSQELESAFRAKAHELRIPVESAKKLFGWYNQVAVESVREANKQAAVTEEQKREEKAKAYVAAQDELQRQWGADFAVRIDGARRTFQNDRVVDPELRKEIQAAGLDNSPRMVRLMDLIARASRSDRQIGLGSEAGESRQQEGIDYGEGFRRRYAR